MRPLDVVLFDDEPAQLASFGRRLTEIFKESVKGIYIEQIRIFRDQKLDVQFETIVRQLTKRRPHIVIVDNVLNQIDGSGQRLISKVKPHLPDAVFCLITRETVKSSLFGLWIPNPDFVISKLYLNAGEPNLYKAYVRETIPSSCIKIHADRQERA